MKNHSSTSEQNLQFDFVMLLTDQIQFLPVMGFTVVGIIKGITDCNCIIYKYKTG